MEFKKGDLVYYPGNSWPRFWVITGPLAQHTQKDGVKYGFYPAARLPRVKVRAENDRAITISERELALAPPKLVAQLYCYGDIIECYSTHLTDRCQYHAGDTWQVAGFVTDPKDKHFNHIVVRLPGSAGSLGPRDGAWNRYVRPQDACLIYQPNPTANLEYVLSRAIEELNPELY